LKLTNDVINYAKAPVDFTKQVVLAICLCLLWSILVMKIIMVIPIVFKLFLGDLSDIAMNTQNIVDI
jgi:hypothetical protein